jgi:hypothetical protein
MFGVVQAVGQAFRMRANTMQTLACWLGKHMPGEVWDPTDVCSRMNGGQFRLEPSHQPDEGSGHCVGFACCGQEPRMKRFQYIR